MDHFTGNLIAQKREWEKLLYKAERRLAHAPDGSVLVKTSRGKYHQYYYSGQNNARDKKYAGKAELPHIKRIIQRDYDRKVKKLLEKRLSSLESLLKLCEKESLTDLYHMLPPARKCLVTPIQETDTEFVENWFSAHRASSNSYPLQSVILTNKKETVRSKSEKIIADKLNEMNVPYVYEAPLFLSGYGTVYPDFTVLNVRARETVYLEHFGMMDDPEYAGKMQKKLLAYQKNDLWFGNGLLYTFESEGNPLDVEVLEEMILKYLI